MMQRASYAPAPAGASVTAGPRAGSGSRSTIGATSPVTEVTIPSEGARPATSAASTVGMRRATSWRKNFPYGGGPSRPDPRRRASSVTEDRDHSKRRTVSALGGSGVGTGGISTRPGDPIDDEEVLLHYQDVREELELSGHNLTSVLNNPRETFMDSLYEAAFEAEAPLPDLDVMRANLPKELREVTREEMDTYIRKTDVLTRTFERNHGPSPGPGIQEGFTGGSRGAKRVSVGAANGPSPRRASAGDGSVFGVEEAPRYGLGIRRFRNTGSLGSTDERSASAAAAAAVAASASSGVGSALGEVSTNTGMSSMDNGGVKRGERDPSGNGKSSVAQCFEQVPGMFFDKTFSLQDPTVFEEAVMAAGAEQPERLAHYLDLVEVCLLKQISHRSNAFFEGLKTSQDLQMHVAGACTTLYQLRESMRCMQQEVATGPMRVPQLQRRRNNLAALEATMELVAGVQQSQAAVQGLLAAEDFLGALDILQSAKSTVKNELGKLQSLKNVGRQLAEYEELVSELLSNRFVTLAVSIPVETAAAIAESGDGESWEVVTGAEKGGAADSSVGMSVSSGEELRKDLQVVVQGLLRLGEMEKVLGVVQERVSEELKLIIRTVVGDYLATTDDSGELLDSFHLFSDDTTGTGEKGDDSDAAGEGGDKGAGGGDDGDQAKAAAADGQKMPKLKALDGEAFASCLEMCFEHMLSVLARISQIHVALVSIVDSCEQQQPDGDSIRKENGNVKEFQEEGRRLDDRDGEREVDAKGGGGGSEEGTGGAGGKLPRFVLTKERGVAIVERSRSCLRALSELMERSVSQLLSVRREHNCTKLDVKELKHLWDITVSFIQSVERLSGCNGYKLRNTLLSQAKAFVESRHEANKQTLVKRLDAEKWAQSDVTPERQAVLDRLSSGNVFPPAPKAQRNTGAGGVHEEMNGNTNGPLLALPGDLPAQPNFVGGSRTVRKGSRGERRREAVVGGSSYKAVGSALLVSEMAVNFLQFAAYFPAIVTDIVSRLSELLRIFNSRSTQLVLGAGAIHSAANLKSISAKHLALCSQSLGLVRALIPYLKAALATRLPQKHHLLLAQMDTVAQDYRDHRDKILNKFVSMIEELIDTRSSSLKLTNWDAPGDASLSGSGEEGVAGGGEPCQFTADVRKAVTTMHNILQQQLPPEQLQAVFRRMFSVITRKVPACFQREGVSPSTETGRQRILDDIGFACAALSTLRGVDSSTLGLEQAIADVYGKGLGGSNNGGSGSVDKAFLGSVASDGRS